MKWTKNHPLIKFLGAHFFHEYCKNNKEFFQTAGPRRNYGICVQYDHDVKRFRLFLSDNDIDQPNIYVDSEAEVFERLEILYLDNGMTGKVIQLLAVKAAYYNEKQCGIHEKSSDDLEARP